MDQSIPAHYDPPQKDLDPDPGFHGLLPPTLSPDDLAMDVLNAGREMAGDVPVVDRQRADLRQYGAQQRHPV